jgi:hypothetical protein
MSSTANMMRCRPSVLAGGVFVWTVTAAGGVILREFEPAVAVRSPHHCDLGPDAGEAHDAVHPISFDLHPALQHQAKFGKELDRSIEVLNDDGDVVHPQKLGHRLLFSVPLNKLSQEFSPIENTFR